MTGSVPIFLSFCEKYVLVTLWNVLNIYSDQTHNKEKPDSRKWTAPRPTQLAPQCRRHCQAVSFDQIWFQFSEYGKIKRSVHLIDLYFTFEKSCLTNLIFLSLLNMIFAGYTNSKIKVQNRQKKSSFSDLIQVQMLQQKIEFVQLDSSADVASFLYFMSYVFKKTQQPWFYERVVFMRDNDGATTTDHFILLKFKYSEKATKFCRISTLLLTGTT